MRGVNADTANANYNMLEKIIIMKSATTTRKKDTSQNNKAISTWNEPVYRYLYLY